MREIAKKLIKQTFQRFNVGITRYDNLQQLIDAHQQLIEDRRAGDDIELLLKLPDEHKSSLLKLLKESKSQLRQALFVLSESRFKRDGFFVEFGATDGVNLSNTYLLEKQYGWRGILAEPAKRWHGDLLNNRECYIEPKCVWSKSDSRVVFNETDKPEFSTIDTYSSRDLHRGIREHGTTYEVETISLLDLLEKYAAPKEIDYLSLDTEGSEYDILSSFDFSKYQFRVITCEHNFAPMREKIHELLRSKGYLRKFEEVSAFDDWYVKAI